MSVMKLILSPLKVSIRGTTYFVDSRDGLTFVAKSDVKQFKNHQFVGAAEGIGIKRQEILLQ
jgi:hypothetical protein